MSSKHFSQHCSQLNKPPDKYFRERNVYTLRTFKWISLKGLDLSVHPDPILYCARYYHLTTHPWIAYTASTGRLPIFKLQQFVYSRARRTQISYSHHERTRVILQYINPAMKIYPELTREVILYTSLLYCSSILFAWKCTHNSQPCSLHTCMCCSQY